MESMPELTVQQALAAAMQQHQQGKLREAEAVYRQILAVQPNNPDALHLLGTLAGQVGKHEAAIELIYRAIAANPSAALVSTRPAVASRTDSGERPRRRNVLRCAT